MTVGAASTCITCCDALSAVSTQWKSTTVTRDRQDTLNSTHTWSVGPGCSRGASALAGCCDHRLRCAQCGGYYTMEEHYCNPNLRHTELHTYLVCGAWGGRVGHLHWLGAVSSVPVFQKTHTRDDGLPLRTQLISCVEFLPFPLRTTALFKCVLITINPQCMLMILCWHCWYSLVDRLFSGRVETVRLCQGACARENLDEVCLPRGISTHRFPHGSKLTHTHISINWRTTH